MRGIYCLQSDTKDSTCNNQQNTELCFILKLNTRGKDTEVHGSRVDSQKDVTQFWPFWDLVSKYALLLGQKRLN